MKLLKLKIIIAVIFLSLNVMAQTNSSIKPVVDSYIMLKDALVKTDGNLSAQSAKNLLATIELVKIADLNADLQETWTKVLNELKEDATHISETKEVVHQRDHFISLSKNMYSVIKISKLGVPVFYQFCPMANKGKGASWLSMEKQIRNPYYGSQMLSCGKVLETITN